MKSGRIRLPTPDVAGVCVCCTLMEGRCLVSTLRQFPSKRKSRALRRGEG